MPKRLADRLHQKDGRWYGDFSDYDSEDVGDGMVPLVPARDEPATRSKAEALRLLPEYLAAFRTRRARRAENRVFESDPMLRETWDAVAEWQERGIDLAQQLLVDLTEAKTAGEVLRCRLIRQFLKNFPSLILFLARARYDGRLSRGG